MTITSPVSMSKIVSEFGGPNNLKAYYRGGAYVPNIPENQNISTNPNQLAISQFLGAKKELPLVLKYNKFRVKGYGNDNAQVNFAYGQLTLKPDGTFVLKGGPYYHSLISPSVTGVWLTSGDLSQYEVRVLSPTIAHINESWSANYPGKGTSIWQSADTELFFYMKHPSKSDLKHTFPIKIKKKTESYPNIAAEITLEIYTKNGN